jgi:hypothetical protein
MALALTAKVFEGGCQRKPFRRQDPFTGKYQIMMN